MINPASGLGGGGRVVREVPLAGEVPILAHPEWTERFPWLCQGMTMSRSATGVDFDLRLFGPEPRAEVPARWEALARATGFGRVVHARQLHGDRVRAHSSSDPPPSRALHLADDCDGHCTGSESVLLTVATADCVPISIVDPERRVVALLHAGWRGVAAGILEGGVAALRDDFGVEPERAHVHLGPAICGACYEVGGEVLVALGLPEPARAALLDLRKIIAGRALSLGIGKEKLTISGLCTRCGGSPLFSHRGGDGGRQVALLGIRPHIPYSIE